MSTTPATQIQPSHHSLILGFFYAALAAALWSLITPFSRELFDCGVDPLATAFWRPLLGGLCFAVYAAATRCLRVPFRDGLIMFVTGGLVGALMFGSFQVSIDKSGGATAVVLLYTAPAWVAILSRILFHEGISRTKLAAIVIALLGVILVSLSGGSHSQSFSTLGIVCGLAAGFGYAAYFPYTFWFVRKSRVQTIYTYAFLGSAAFLLPFSWPLHTAYSVSVWAQLVGMSVFTNFLAYIALGLSLKRISQVQSAVIGNIEPVLGTFWVWLLFDENFSAAGWVGCAFIMLAVFLLTLEKGARSTQ
ncbi:MAG TPA: EamA family transporter [Candidatus Desulfovibrio intestinipullorum]|uniref:EamA family transporter n=1 Tax=Candidatus Desulfovibrio intestinipullorum TaxID=2838536 RepID=A0A9D1PWP4_9BACT|nr:EamA family transporter [Candidatus Desulfovibrio intestinipullorum]